MEFVAIVTVLALLEYSFFSFQVGQARGKYDVEAPAVTGHPIFERHHRVHQNTLEQLALFLPGLWLFGQYASWNVAAGLGLVFIIGRAIYARRYLAAPESRAPGVLVSFLASAILLLGGLIGAITKLLG